MRTLKLEINLKESAMLKTSDVLRETKIPFYQLDYLVKAGRIHAFRTGRGIERRFPPDTIEKIKAILKKRNPD